MRATLLLVLLSACGGTTTPPQEAAPYPTHLVMPADLPGQWALEQDVTIHHAEGESSFHAVLQKQDNTLTMVGLGPAGGRAFVLTQNGMDFDWQTFVTIELPFPPEYMLYDVHRTWLQPNQPPVDGSSEMTFERDGERIHERWNGGKLLERTFERLDGVPAGKIVVDYEGGMAPNAPAEVAPPDVVDFDNQWHGYRSTIHTLRYTPL